MAFPFTDFPTLQEFVARVCTEFGCTAEEIEKLLNNAPTKFRYLKREVAGKTYYCELGDLKDDQNLVPNVLETLCNRLRVPPKAFGLDF